MTVIEMRYYENVIEANRKTADFNKKLLSEFKEMNKTLKSIQMKINSIDNPVKMVRVAKEEIGDIKVCPICNEITCDEDCFNHDRK